MQSIRAAVVTLLFAGTLAACGSVDPEPLPPATVMIPYSQSPFIERGIRPDPDAGDAESPESGGILVEWERLGTSRLGSVSLGGYNLYRAEKEDAAGAPIDFKRIATIAESVVGNDTSYTDTLVDASVRYWYAVRATVRGTGNEGPMSNAVAYMLTQRPVPISPEGQLDSAGAAPLVFRYGPPFLGGEVAMHLYRVHPNNERLVIDTVWRELARGTYDDPRVVYNGPALESGAHYRWRIDKVAAGQPFGNASRWVTFIAP